MEQVKTKTERKRQEKKSRKKEGKDNTKEQTRRKVKNKKRVEKEGQPRKYAARLKTFVVSSEKIMRYELVTNRTAISSANDTRPVPCESVLTEAKNEIRRRGESGQHWCALIGGSYYDYEAIQKCLQKYALKTQRSEIEQELSWLTKVSDHVHQPVGTSKVDTAIARRLISHIQNKPGNEKCNDVEISVDNLKQLVASRWINSEILDRFVAIINLQSSETYALSLSIGRDASQVAAKLARTFKKKWPDSLPKKIVFYVNVVNVNNITYLDYANIDGVYYAGNHFATCVYYFESDTLFYGDSLGYPFPVGLEGIFKDILALVGSKERAERCKIKSMHCTSLGTDTNGHVCNNKCWSYFPLQKDSTICGIATLMCMALAAFDDASFFSLRGLPSKRFSHFRYIKDVSQYNDFLRLTAAKWLFSSYIDLSLARGCIDESMNQPADDNNSNVFVGPSSMTKEMPSENAEHRSREWSKPSKFSRNDFEKQPYTKTAGMRSSTPERFSSVKQDRPSKDAEHNSKEEPTQSDLNKKHCDKRKTSKAAGARSTTSPERLSSVKREKPSKCAGHNSKAGHSSKEEPKRPDFDLNNCNERPSSSTSPERFSSVKQERPSEYETDPDGEGDSIEETSTFRFHDGVEQLEDPSVPSEVEENGDERNLPPSPSSLNDDQHAEYQSAKATRIEGNDADNNPLMSELSHQEGGISPSELALHCNEEGRKCNEKRNHYHCALCPLSRTEYYISRIKDHIAKSHLKQEKIVVFQNIWVLPCKLFHIEKQFANNAINHYHCPECGSIVQQKAYFEKHLNAHTKKSSRAKPNKKRPERNRCQAQAQQTSTHTNPNNSKEEAQFEPSAHVGRASASSRVQCQICHVFITNKNMKRHYKSKHDRETTVTAVCCDRRRGLYMVRNSSHGGVGFPIHVQKIVNANEGNVTDCEVEGCRIEMDIARRSDMTGRECPHLLQVNDAFFPEELELDDLALYELGASRKYKVLKDETVDKCSSQKVAAAADNAAAVIEWEEGNHIHLSIFDGKHSNNPVKMRYIVTFSKKDSRLVCRCRLSRCFCLHKAMALWYLHQTKRINNSAAIDERPDSSESSDENINNENDNKDASSERLESIIYPPASSRSALQMIQYMKANKRIPFPPPDNFRKINHEELPIAYKPTEVNCHECKRILSGPYRITHRARILTLQGFLEGIETYFKMCKHCNNYYRYQEFDNGVHNYDDTFLLGIDVCIFLRSAIKNHVAVGSICCIIKDIWAFPIDLQKVLDAYTHFDALSHKPYEFNCVLCGYHPVVLIADVNRKVVFKYTAPDEELPDENDETSDFVHCDGFWDRVLISVLSKGFVGRKYEGIDIKPLLSNWAPFIGRQSRIGHYVLNSEHRKIQRDNGEPEADCRIMSEERLIEDMLEGTRKDIQRLAREVKVNATGSKLDIINRVKASLGKDNSTFNKVFKKRFGRSGGWLTLACKHGIVYAVKFLLRSESPRDYIDVIRSLKIPPNVFINDIAHMVAAHGNRHHPGLFSPFEGRVAENTPDNIDAALANRLKISLPWLNNDLPYIDEPEEGGYHPVTGSNVKMVLFDKFHETNTCREVESLRRIGCIKELDSKVNSEVAEQLHGAYNKNKHFLNQMTPTNHIFLFRSIIDSKNIEKNKRNLEKAKKHHLFTNFDPIGRPVYGHEDIPYNPFAEDDVMDSGNEDEEGSSYSSGQEDDHSSGSCSRDSSSDSYSSSGSNINNRTYNHATERNQDDDLTDNECPNSEPRGYAQEHGNIDSESIGNVSNISELFCQIFGSDITLSGEECSIGQDTTNEQTEADDKCFPPMEFDEDVCSLPSNNESESKAEAEPPAVVSSETEVESDSDGNINCDEGQTTNEIEQDVGSVSSVIDLDGEHESSTSCMSDTSILSDSVIITKEVDGTERSATQNETWIPELSLSRFERCILDTRSAFTSALCDAAMQIIKASCNDFAGLQNISTLDEYVGDGRPFIQIVPLRQSKSKFNTWGTLSNVLSKKGHVTLYDSATRSYYIPSKREVRYHVSLDLYATKFRNLPLDELVIDVARVDTVNKNALTGTAAIFHAVCLSRKIDPCSIAFRYQALRRDLSRYLEKQSFKDAKFHSTPRARSTTLFEITVDLHCHCKMPYISEPMTDCLNCGKWFHERCETGNMATRAWKCKNCTISNTKTGKNEKRTATKNIDACGVAAKKVKLGASNVKSTPKSHQPRDKRSEKKTASKGKGKNRLFKDLLKNVTSPENESSSDSDS